MKNNNNNNSIKNQKLYLDTSVPSVYHDDRQPERQEMTREFWNKLDDFDIHTSTLVKKEVEQVEDKQLKQKLLRLIENHEILKLSDEAKKLGKEYIKNKIIPEKAEADAYHIAIATVNQMDFLVSWNFRHMVKVKTKRMVNIVNLQNGYKTIEIIAPPEL